MKKINAIILSGQTSRDDLICELVGVPKKAFIRFGSKTILQRQVEELLKCDFIDRIYLSGMTSEEWDTDLPVVFVDEQGTIFDKVSAVYKNYVIKEENYSEYAFILSSDVPFVKSDMIRRCAEKCAEDSGGEIDGIFYYSIVPKEIMLERFPNVQRGWMKFKDLHFCGADLTLINPGRLMDYKKIIDDLGSQRKSVIGQLILLDPILVFLYLIKRLTVPRLLKFFNKKLFKVERGIYAPIIEDAELAMDIDKPEHYEAALKFYEENKELYD